MPDDTDEEIGTTNDVTTVVGGKDVADGDVVIVGTAVGDEEEDDAVVEWVDWTSLEQNDNVTNSHDDPKDDYRNDDDDGKEGYTGVKHSSLTPTKRTQRVGEQEEGDTETSVTETPLASKNTGTSSWNSSEDAIRRNKELQRKADKFWHHYDECCILCLGAQLGILLRKISNAFTSNLDLVFNKDSALAPDLPVNCLALFLLGVFSSGNDALDVVKYDDAKRSERHDIALQAFERRIRASVSVVLFPAKISEEDALVSYVHNEEVDETSKSNNCNRNILSPAGEDTKQCRQRKNSPAVDQDTQRHKRTSIYTHNSSDGFHENSKGLTLHSNATKPLEIENSNDEAENFDLQQLHLNTQQAVVVIAEGWDVGTTPEAMKYDLMTGLRVGFCGALSTFSAWNGDMVNLLRKGDVDDALVGYVLGVFLPIIAYRLGQHCALGYFLYRARKKLHRDERRTGGYRLRIHGSDVDDENESHQPTNLRASRSLIEDMSDRRYPSVRATVTAIFSLVLVTQITALFVFTSRSQQQFTIALLFSPFGVLARRQLLFLNYRYTPKSLIRAICRKAFPACFSSDKIEEQTFSGRKEYEDLRIVDTKFSGVFPVGTFLCNMLGCILSSSLGSLLAGNPGPKESIVLESIIMGFAGSLSTLAFLIEVVSSVDPLVADYSGFKYGLTTLAGGLIVGLISSSF